MTDTEQKTDEQRFAELTEEFARHVDDAAIPYANEIERTQLANKLRQAVCQKMVDTVAQELADQILAAEEAVAEEADGPPPEPLAPGQTPPPSV